MNNKPTVCGIGYTGEGEYKFSNSKKEYHLWRGILRRCYVRGSECYDDVFVDERWHNFNTFCKDIKEFNNYEKWLKTKKEYVLDKDKLSGEKKIYSKETCCFITVRENVDLVNDKKMFDVIATNEITGEVVEFRNKNKFSKERGLNPSAVSACIKGKRNRHLNWVFEIKT